MSLSRDPRARKRQLANLRKAPAAPKDNKRRMTHGAKAQPDAKRLAEIEGDICAALPVRDSNNEAPVHDLAAVHLLAVAVARLETVSAYVDRYGSFYKGGRLRPAAEHEQKLIERVGSLLDRLGLTPASRARIGVDLVRTRDLAREMSGMDAIDAEVVDDA